jgi:hypothetical protein
MTRMDLIKLIRFEFGIENFEIFEDSIRGGKIAIVVTEWCWWWKRNRISKKLIESKPISTRVALFFCKKDYGL